jgi:hypothetical protein
MHVARLKIELLSLSDTLLPKINNIHSDPNAERSAVQWLTIFDTSSHAEDAQRKSDAKRMDRLAVLGKYRQWIAQGAE